MAAGRLDRELRDGERIEVCVANRGDRRVALYGGPAQAARTSSAYVDGRRLPTDIALVFERDHARSALRARTHRVRARGAVQAAWMGTWLVWVLAIAVLFAVPLLVAAGAAALPRRARARRD